jgi:CRP-like cAMP-binding protein
LLILVKPGRAVCRHALLSRNPIKSRVTKAKPPAASTPDPLTLLERQPLFQGVGERALRSLAGSVRCLRLANGEILFRRGAPCTGIHVVVDGLIKLTLQAPDGAEKVIDLVEPGRSFGEAVMFLDMPYYVSAEACAESLLLHVDKEAVFHLVDHEPVFARRMLAGLSARLHEMVRDVESYSLHSGTQRVVDYLLHEVPQQPGETGTTIVLPVKKGVIASRLNLTQEHFSRVLHDLANRGLIHIHGREITIPDIGKMKGTEAR